MLLSVILILLLATANRSTLASTTSDFVQYIADHHEYTNTTVYGLGPDFTELVMRKALLNVRHSVRLGFRTWILTFGNRAVRLNDEDLERH